MRPRRYPSLYVQSHVITIHHQGVKTHSGRLLGGDYVLDDEMRQAEEKVEGLREMMLSAPGDERVMTDHGQAVKALNTFYVSMHHHTWGVLLRLPAPTWHAANLGVVVFQQRSKSFGVYSKTEGTLFYNHAKATYGNEGRFEVSRHTSCRQNQHPGHQDQFHFPAELMSFPRCLILLPNNDRQKLKRLHPAMEAKTASSQLDTILSPDVFRPPLNLRHERHVSLGAPSAAACSVVHAAMPAE